MNMENKIVITLDAYVGRGYYGFGTFEATTDNGQRVTIDLHIDGTIEPFAEWAEDDTTPIEEMHQRCESMVGRQVEVEFMSAMHYIASNGKLL